MTDLIVTQAARDALKSSLENLWNAAPSYEDLGDWLNQNSEQIMAILSDNAITEAEERGARLMQEAAAKLCDAEGAYEQEGYGLNRGTQNYFRARNAIRALDPVTIIARATLTEAPHDR